LTEGSRKFTAGKLDYRVKVQGTDEIGKLAISFNQMAEGLKSSQGQLIQSGKLAAVGELGAGIAHELNNPLTGILGYAQYLIEKTKKIDFNIDNFKACVRQIEYIEKEAQRCKNIVQSLLKFSRKSYDKFESLNINQIIEDTLSLVGHQLTMNNITLIKELEPDLKEIIGNGNQLQQVFTNIIINAQQAMSNKGELRIETRNKDGSIEIEFADTGCGIPEENLNKIFDPFFTTKKDWRGTGLGLSISYNIIHDHKGSIDVKSEVGKGTTFSITLPV
jgi:signal transduction histidine kinase